jgi:putative polyhydroxyalkanoate system protein
VAEIHIVREHALGLAGARRVARQWASQAEDQFGMECRHEHGRGGDRVHFSRLGASGTLEVGRDRFEVRARLGLLLGVLRGRIEAEIVGRLDALLNQRPAANKPAAAKKTSATKKAPAGRSAKAGAGR